MRTSMERRMREELRVFIAVVFCCFGVDWLTISMKEKSSEAKVSGFITICKYLLRYFLKRVRAAQKRVGWLRRWGETANFALQKKLL